MKRVVLASLGIGLLVGACEKRKYPKEQIRLEEEPIFVNATVDGEPVNLKIGTDGYYCYSSHSQTTDSVYFFKGELRKYNCQTCPLSLMVELSDYQKSLPGSPISPDITFEKGSRLFLPGLSKTYSVEFRALSNKTISSTRWSLANGVSSNDSVFQFDFGKPGVQTVSLTIKTDQGCENVISRSIYLSEASLFACDAQVQSIGNNSFDFSASRVGGQAPFHYTWYFGDGEISTDSNPTHQYSYPGSYPLKLQVEDANGHLCESNSIQVVGSDLSSCSSDMKMTPISVKQVLLRGVKIQWTDRSNVVLRSDSIDQPPGAYFEVVDSQPYETNENGETGRLLTLRFNVLLQGGNRQVWFKTENTAIAVSYK